MHQLLKRHITISKIQNKKNKLLDIKNIDFLLELTGCKLFLLLRCNRNK